MDFWELVVLLEKSGLCDPKHHPEVAAAVEWWRETGDPSELELVLNFDSGLVHHALMRVESTPYVPPVSSVEAALISGDYLVGEVYGSGHKLFLKKKDFCRGVAGFGAPGTGKSYLMRVLANQMLSVPPWLRGFSAFFVQWGKDDVGRFALKYPDWFYVLDFEDLPYNPMMPQRGEDPRRRINAFIETFASENYLGTLSKPILDFAVGEAFRVNGVFDGSKKYPTFRELDRFCDQYAADNKLRGYNVRDAVDRTKNRLSAFKKYDNLNVRRGLEAKDFLAHDYCLNVGNTDEAVARTAITSIFDDVNYYLMENPPGPGVDLRWLLFVDEARILFEAKQGRLDFGGGKKLEWLYTQSRSQGVGRAAFTQELQSIPPFIPSNSPFLFMFPSYGDALDKAAQNLNLSDEQRDHVFCLPTPGVCVTRFPAIDRPIVCRVDKGLGRLPPGSPGDVRAHMKPFIDSLHASFDKLNEEVSVVPERRDSAGLSKDERKVLGVLAGNPFLNKSDLRDATQLFGKLDGVVDVLKNRGFIIEKSCVGKTRNAAYYPLLSKTHDYLRLARGSRVDPKFFEHSLYMFWVASWLKRQGLSAVPEYSRAGVKGRIDVFCGDTNTAYEVQRNIKNVFSNLQKCFDDFSVDRLVFVCETKAMAQQCQKEVEQRAPKDYLKKVKKKVDYVLIRSMI